MHLTIGRIMFELSKSDAGERWMFLVAVDQLDRGSAYIEDGNDRVELAKLNLEAATLVAEKSAFFPAADYLTKGTELLGDEYAERNYMWMDQYDLCLELYSLSAEMEYCCGRFDRAKEQVEIVLAHAKSLVAKTRVYFVLVEILGVQKRFLELLAIGHKLLRELREPWPRKVRLHHVLFEMMRVKPVVKRLNDDSIRRLPAMKDENRICVLKTLASMATFAW